MNYVAGASLGEAKQADIMALIAAFETLRSPSRVHIPKASMRKSVVNPQVDFEYLAEQTHGYKLAIRSSIAAQVEQLKKIEAGKLDPDEAEAQEAWEEANEVSVITMMMHLALEENKCSVSPAEYQKHLSMKVQFDREAGIVNYNQAGVDRPASPWRRAWCRTRRMPAHSSTLSWVTTAQTKESQVKEDIVDLDLRTYRQRTVIRKQDRTKKQSDKYSIIVVVKESTNGHRFVLWTQLSFATPCLLVRVFYLFDISRNFLRVTTGSEGKFRAVAISVRTVWIDQWQSSLKAS